MQLCRCKFVQNMTHVLYLYAVSYTGDGITQITWITSVLEIHRGDHKPSISVNLEDDTQLSLNYLGLFFFFFGLEKLLFYLHFLKDPFAGYRMLESESHSVVSDSLWPRGLYSPWNSLGQKLEWVAVLFLRGSSQPRDRTQVSHIAGRFFTSWATGETQTFHLSKLGRWYMAFNKLSQLFYLPGKVFVCLESWVDRLFLPSFFSFLPWFHCLLTRLL